MQNVSIERDKASLSAHLHALKELLSKCTKLEERDQELEVQLQEEVTRPGQAKRINSELRGEHQATCDLLQSKNRLLELSQAEIIQLRESPSQAIAQQEEQGARWESNLAMLKTTTTFKPKMHHIPSLITKD